MKLLSNLNEDEKKQVLLAPVFISLLAANADGELDEGEKAIAIKITHCKTYTSDPALKEFYEEVLQTFETNIDKYDAELPKGQSFRKRAIDMELQKLVPVLLKLGEEEARQLYKSLQSYTDHVSRAHWNVPNDPMICLELEGIPF